MAQIRGPAGELVASAGRVRERMREDPAVPAWARALLPVIAALQLAAIHLARPAYLAARRLVARAPFEHLLNCDFFAQPPRQAAGDRLDSRATKSEGRASRLWGERGGQ